MAWYRTATVTVTNGSTIVTGSGTAWVGAIYAGWGFNGPNGQVIEIASVDSATQITLVSAYLGSTQAGAAYSIIPTQGLEQALAASLSSLLSNYQGVYDGAGQGKFPDGTAAAPGLRFAADEDTGLYRPASNQLAAAAGGVLRWLLSSTAFQIDVPVTGTAVQSSATDATAGRLLKVGSMQVAGGLRVTYGGSANVITLTAANAPGALINGMRVRFRATAANTGATTINLGGLGAVSCVTVTGAALPAGYIRTDVDTEATYNGTNWVVAREAERGQNANGAYVRLANGLQICTKNFSLTGQNVDTAYGSLGQYSSANLLSGQTLTAATFAGGAATEISFALTAYMSNFTAGTLIGGAGDINNFPSTLYVVAPQSLTDRTIYVRCQAIGRWY